MTEGEYSAVPPDLMRELLRIAEESAARSRRLFDGDRIDDVMWEIPEFGGEW